MDDLVYRNRSDDSDAALRYNRRRNYGDAAVRDRYAALLLSVALSSPVAALPLTFAWDSGPGWPAGTTVELCANGACASGIAGNSAELEVPIQPGQALAAQVRAIPPAGYLCGEPLADCSPSAYAMLAARLPVLPIDVRATYHLQEIIPMAIARRGSTNYSAEMYNNSSSVAITKESTVAVGDIIFIAVSSYGEGTGSGNGASVTGFTKIVDQDFNGSRASLLWRVVDGTEGSTFNVTIGGMEWRCAGVVLIAFSGTGLSIDTSNFTYNGASVTSLVAPSLTAAAANELLVNFFLYSDPGTFTAPSGADGSFANSPQNTNGAAVSWDAIASSGATGTRTATIGTARSALSVSVLLKETGASATSRPLIRSYQFAHLVGR